MAADRIGRQMWYLRASAGIHQPIKFAKAGNKIKRRNDVRATNV